MGRFWACLAVCSTVFINAAQAAPDPKCLTEEELRTVATAMESVRVDLIRTVCKKKFPQLQVEADEMYSKWSTLEKSLLANELRQGDVLTARVMGEDAAVKMGHNFAATEGTELISFATDTECRTFIMRSAAIARGVEPLNRSDAKAIVTDIL